MLELLQRLFIGHAHKYIVKEQMMIRNSTPSDGYAGKIIIQECEICGKLFNHRVMSE